MLRNNAALKRKIDELWNKFWSGGISNPLTAIEQITYLLFMKRMDNLDHEQERAAEFSGDKFTSRFSGTWIPTEHRGKSKKEQKQYAIEKQSLRWKEFRRMKAEVMLSHVNDKVFPFIKDMKGEQSSFTHHMKNAYFDIRKPSLLVEAVKTIDEIFELMEEDDDNFQDIQGDVYEYLLSEIATAGKNGQFRTPRHIIKLIVELVQPQLGNRIADPACGSGGFLLAAYQYIITQDALKRQKKKDLKPDQDGFIRTSSSAGITEKAKKSLNESLWGYDIDSTMVRLGIMNLMMHGIEEPHIDYKDTLSKGFNEPNEYNIIMANPPFTGSIDKGDINEELSLNTTKTELLFIENIYRMLRKGGTAGVIIPQGVLTGANKAFVETKKILVDRCNLKAVVTMPSGVFKPYAGVSTAVLIFTKVYDKEDKIDEPCTQHTWFYKMQDDGYTLDDKRNKKEGFGDLQDIVEKYSERDSEKGTDRTKNYFFVPRQEIVDEKYDLSFSSYKEDVFEEIEYKKPDEILRQLIESEVGERADEEVLKKINGGVLKKLLELRGMIS